MARPTPVDSELLDEAYASWPGTAHEKTTLRALLLRIRIERMARRLPSTVVAPSRKLDVARRLMLSVGEPGLGHEQRNHRLEIVRASVAAYRQICDVLHGRNPELRPPLDDVRAWEAAVDLLEAELLRHQTIPAQRGRGDGAGESGGLGKRHHRPPQPK